VPRLRPLIVFGLGALAALLLAATASAVLPKANKSFTGTFGRAPSTTKLSFKSSANSHALTSFKFQTFGCEGGGGPGGVPYFTIKSITVKSNGTFSLTVRHNIFTTPTEVTLSGRFKSAAKVTGTIRISQTFPPADLVPGNACHSPQLPFSATTH
jgi:hypothetical protein